MKSRANFAAALAVVLLGGCVVGPDYKKPEAGSIPPAYAGATNGWKVAEPKAHWPKDRWWELFGIAELNQLEDQAAAANQELKAAVARFDQARALLTLARAGFLPRVEASPTASRQRDSANRPVNGVSSGRPETYTTFTVPLDLSYEIDLWGRVRRTVQAAAANQAANAADVESVMLAIQAEVATDFFALRALDAENTLLRSSVEVFHKSLELTRNRRTGGIASDLDVAQAETVLRSTETQLPAVALERVKLEHALAVLTGHPASTFMVAEQSLELSPPSIPQGLPSELLERRPDIAAAERRMAAANANIGIATAAFFPVLRFNGRAGFESVDAGTLFDWPSRLWAVGPGLTMPLFEGGRNRAGLAQAKAAYEETVARYRQSVLVAFEEVEDSLAAQSLLASEQRAETAALESARKTLEIASNRYRAGLVTYLEVATAQSAELNHERTSVRLHGQQLVATVVLIKSLGGGWRGAEARQ